jgi:TatD DNase family protein
MIFDSHNHLQSDKFEIPVSDLISQMKSQGVCGCVVNATREEDWDRVSVLAEEHPDFIRPAYGIHPWFAHTASDAWEQRLRARLENNPKASVGECGLDRWVKAPAIDVQFEVFLKQVEIAADMERCLTVHCLKAWQELFAAIDQAPRWPKKFLMHSFAGSIEIAERLIKKGAWFSFSGYFLQQRKIKVLEMFQQLDPSRILLETDSPDMLPPENLIEFPLNGGANHPANIRSIGAAFSAATDSSILSRIMENSRKFWDLSH